MQLSMRKLAMSRFLQLKGETFSEYRWCNELVPEEMNRAEGFRLEETRAVSRAVTVSWSTTPRS